jgi:hypothetical protein
MTNVIDFPKKGEFEIMYTVDEEDNVIGVSREDWDFRIQRCNDRIAFVSKSDNQPFGELDAEVFNTILGCWLLIDDVETLKSFSEGLHDVKWD